MFSVGRSMFDVLSLSPNISILGLQERVFDLLSRVPPGGSAAGRVTLTRGIQLEHLTQLPSLWRQHIT